MQDLMRLLAFLLRLSRDVRQARLRVLLVVLLGIASGPASAGVLALINRILSGAGPATPATLWGFADRGLVREGFAADLVVFDPDTIAPEMPEVAHDLPAGARRLVQRARGIAATVVNGEVLLRDGKHTGALPGQLLRGPRARRA